MIRVIDIAQIVCLALGADVAEVMSDRRKKAAIEARHVTMYLANRLLPDTAVDIGKQMGGRDHTTILHGVAKIAAEIESDTRLKALVNSLQATLEYRMTLESLGGIDPLAAAREIVLRPRRAALERSTYELAALAVFTLDLWEVASCAEALARSIELIDLPEPYDAGLPRMQALAAAIIDEMNHIAGPAPAEHGEAA